MKRKSCRSHGERLITEYLKEHNIVFKKEMSFDQCRNEKGNLLRFDFYLPEEQILIEYQGIHHYKPINKYPKAKRVHLITVRHDILKLEFIKTQNFKFLTIPYWEKERISEILNEYLKGDKDAIF